MQVANCTTPAQYFHVLRRQMRGGPNGGPIRKPLVLFTPKSLLRSPKAVSTLDDVVNGSFQEVIDDRTVDPKSVNRVLFCSGKVYYDLVAGRDARKANNAAIVRVEQMYPFPQAQIEAILSRFSPTAEVYWVQEEPRNMGPWRFMHDCLHGVLQASRRMVHYIGRPEYSSPAAGTLKRHEQEQADLVSDAFAPSPVRRAPKRVRIVQKKSS
jgi:2-oxoglutarate dehydrogenase complex dehydrogenase (E1) component-like enzyme